MSKTLSLALCTVILVSLTLGFTVPTVCHAAGPWPRLPTDGEISAAASRVIAENYPNNATTFTTDISNQQTLKFHDPLIDKDTEGSVVVFMFTDTTNYNADYIPSETAYFVVFLEYNEESQRFEFGTMGKSYEHAEDRDAWVASLFRMDPPVVYPLAVTYIGQTVREGPPYIRGFTGDTPPGDIKVSYVLGYDQLGLGEPVPLSVTFQTTDPDERIAGVTFVADESIIANYQRDCTVFQSEDNKCLFDNSFDDIYQGKSAEGVTQVTYEFREVALKWLKDIKPPFEVRFLAFLDMLRNGEKFERKVGVTVRVEAAFTVGMLKAGLKFPPHYSDGAVKLKDSPLPPNAWHRGQPGDSIFIPPEAIALVRFLDGTMASFRSAANDVWQVWPGYSGFASPQVEGKYLDQSDSLISITAKKVEGKAEDMAIKKALEFLIGKAAGGTVTMVLKLSSGKGGEYYIPVRLRSQVGVEVWSDGSAVVRTYEGEPELLQPDGSALPLPAGFESALNPADGSFASPAPFDPNDPSVRFWQDYITGGYTVPPQDQNPPLPPTETPLPPPPPLVTVAPPPPPPPPPTDRGDVVFSDNFDNPEAGQLLAPNADEPAAQVRGYVEGEYMIRNVEPERGTQSATIPNDYTDATMAVDARLVGDTKDRYIGLVGHFAIFDFGMYQLLVYPDAQSFTLRRWDGSQTTALARGTAKAIRTGGQSNHVELSFNGSNIVARINGTQVAAVQDETYPEGGFTMGVGSKPGTGLPAEVRFDNLAVTEP